MTPKITKLTPAQQALLPAIRDEWLAHGLSTQPADRPAAEAGIRAAYQAAGLDPPRFVLWLGSPWGGVIGQAIAPEIIAASLAAAPAWLPTRAELQPPGRDQVRAQVRAQVGAQVGDQVDDQVRAQVGAQVGAQVDAQVGDQVYDQVRAQVDAQVDAQVGDQVGAQVHAQVRDQVRAQVRAQVDAQVRAQVDDQVYDQVRAQVYDQVRAQVDAQVRAQVDAQVRAQVRAQVDDQVYDQVHDRLRDWWRGRIMGQHWAGYYSYYAAMDAIGVTGLDPILSGQAQVARSAGWWWAFSGFAVATERPSQLHRDPDGQLHSATGPAICYPGGWGFHAWHGRRVDPWVVEAPTVERIGAEPNIEVRRCAIEAMGWARFTEEAGLVPVGTTPGTRHRSTELCDARVADPGNPGQHLTLYDVPERLWGSRVRLLMCTNGSPERDGTRRRYGLTVPAEISDPVAAAAWTYDVDPGQYAGLQRRT